MRYIVALMLATSALVIGATSTTAAPVKRMAPCVFEDGSGGPLPCYWDATRRGNHRGTSFWMDRHRKIHRFR